VRTTIEISNELRAKLLALAARKGLRGYSEIVREAVEEYIARQDKKQEALEKVLKLKGSLTSEEADAAEKTIREFWDRWKA